MVSKKMMNKIVGNIGDALANEIFARSQDNLSSKEFAERTMESYLYSDAKGRGKYKSRKFTISNTAMLARSGYKSGSRRSKEWRVGYRAPHAYDNNYGTPPRNTPFGNIYQWAYSRRKDIKENYPSLRPASKSNKQFWKMYKRYNRSLNNADLSKKHGYGNVAGHTMKSTGRGKKKEYNKILQETPLNLLVFSFAYYVWLNIKKDGVEPSFFFSDAVHTTVNESYLIVKRALSNTAGVQVVAS